MERMDSRARSIAKALSWRLLAVTITASLIYIITGDKGVALTVGAIDTAVKLAAFYVHERAWGRVRPGGACDPGDARRR